MKNLIKTGLLLAFVGFFSVAYSQNGIGGKVGVNLGTWNGDTEDFEDLKWHTGLQIGGVLQIGINDLIAIQPELVFIQKGVKSEYEDEFLGEVIKYENDIVFNHLEIPVLVKLSFGDGEGAGFFITAGPSFGYALSGKNKSKITISGETETEEEDFDFDENDDYSRFEISASLGAGVNIPVGLGNLFLEGRYLVGLSDLENEEDDFTIKNGGIGIAAGFMIFFGN